MVSTPPDSGSGRIQPRGHEGERSFAFRPIGYVENSFEKTDRPGPSPGVPSKIILHESFADGLAGLEPGQDATAPPTAGCRPWEGGLPGRFAPGTPLRAGSPPRPRRRA